jgi:hypothetical protein
MRAHAIEGISLHEMKINPANLTVTNAVWVATALLHKNYPERDGFTPEEIVHVVKDFNLTERSEDSIWTHVRQHSVANKRPQPNTVCMLFDPGGGLRRLFRSGDKAYPGKNESRTHPRWEDLPTEYQHLRRWYEEEWNGVGGGENDPLLALVGTWKDEPADEYVAHLRENWGEAR